MEIIDQFLQAMQALLIAKVAIFLAIGISAAIAGLAMRKPWIIGLGLAIAFGQFALPWLSNMGFKSEIESRRQYVNELPKTPIPKDYPPRLVLEGDISPSPAGWFLAAGYVNEVDIGGLRLVANDGGPACRGAALAIVNPDRPGERTEFAGNPYERIKLCTRVAGRASPHADAIILRIGNRTELFDRENARRHGAPRAIQISLRRGGKEVLAHYDEMPILAYPKSATQLLPEGYDYPCSRFAYLQITANLLDAAKQPTKAEGLLQRGAIRRSQYDECVASVAPILKS